jgi:hypothetical protein
MGYSRTTRKGGLQKNVTHPPAPIHIQTTVKKKTSLKNATGEFQTITYHPHKV